MHITGRREASIIGRRSMEPFDPVNMIDTVLILMMNFVSDEGL